MKKNVLALSIAAMIGGLGFAGSAAAQSNFTVSESGMGHMLVVPYYTAQDGNMTVMHVVNTDTNGKAMKVRFRGAANSDDVLDFQVFMSPGDVWTAAVVKGADGVANLVTADGTCTLPAIAKNTPVSFVTDRLPPTGDKANHTREGYVEIFNMADIPASTKPLYTTIKHKSGVAACDGAVLNTTLTESNADLGLVAPTDGLTGSWYIMNVAQTTTFAGAAHAIQSLAATNNIVFSPQSNGGADKTKTADPLFIGTAPVLEIQNYDLPDLSTPYAPGVASANAQASELTAILARKSVINQYAQDASVSAKTDWVFSMPTRRYNVAADYTKATNVAGYKVFNTGVNNGATPAVAWFTPGNTTVNADGLICVTAAGQTFYDREESFKTDGAVFSPGQVSKLNLCGEVHVTNFASGSVLGASVATSSVAGAYTNGWGQVNFSGNGVPVLGSSFIKLTNPSAAAGMSGTYGITWPHAYK